MQRKRIHEKEKKMHLIVEENVEDMQVHKKKCFGKKCYFLKDISAYK